MHPHHPSSPNVSQEALDWANFFLSLYHQQKKVSEQPAASATFPNVSVSGNPPDTPAPRAALSVAAPSASITKATCMHPPSRSKTYRLNEHERLQIYTLKENGYTLRAIAKALNRSVSTISDELKRQANRAEESKRN